jgi:UDP:flavonoid glycosyltransferase YjiC (YdhE family)
MFHGPILLATDPILGLIPSDINKRCLQTGYLHLDQGNQLDETLKAFITSGPPPVYVGFGSMIDKNVEMTNQIIADAAINANQRYIIAGRSTRHSGEQINDNCYLVNETPHSVLFPLVAAVVHHGGAGTTATSAMAGVPQVIVPHTQDQFYWGKRIFNLGLGPKPVPHKTLNSKVLSSAIRESLCNENIQRNVKTVSNIIHNQDSLENAVNYIESEFTINNAIN